jgi:hypothetical protein
VVYTIEVDRWGENERVRGKIIEINLLKNYKS